MTILVNTFEGGTSGSALATASSGGASGNAFDLVVTGSGATNAYDSSQEAHGFLSCKMATGASAVVYEQWTTSMGSQAQAWFRLYLYFTANPTNQHRVLEFVSAGTGAGGVLLTTTGRFQMLNSAGTTITTTASTIPLNAWFRIEGFILGSATVGQTELKFFKSPDAIVPAETNTSAASQNTAGTLDTYRFGVAVAIASVGPFWMDDIGLSNTGYLGPASNPSDRPAVHPGPVWMTNFKPYPPRQRPQALLPGFQQLGEDLLATVTTSGALTSAPANTLSASVTTSGSVSQALSRTFQATVTTAGAITRSAGKILAAVVSALGSLIPAPVRRPPVVTVTPAPQPDITITPGIAPIVTVTPAVQVTITVSQLGQPPFAVFPPMPALAMRPDDPVTFGQGSPVAFRAS